jgi:hypothetical protein
MKFGTTQPPNMCDRLNIHILCSVQHAGCHNVRIRKPVKCSSLADTRTHSIRMPSIRGTLKHNRRRSPSSQHLSAQAGIEALTEFEARHSKSKRPKKTYRDHKMQSSAVREPEERRRNAALDRTPQTQGRTPVLSHQKQRLQTTRELTTSYS